MYRFLNLVTQGLALAPLTALAAPSTFPPDGESKVSRRDDEWHGDSDGNTEIRMSDHQINFGNRRVGWPVDRLTCSDVSCGSNGQDASIETEFVNSVWYLQGTNLNVHASGSFQTQESPGLRNEMMDLAIEAMEAVEETEEWKWHDNPTMRSSRHGESIADSADNEPNVEYWYPEEIHIRINNDDGGSRATLDLIFSVDSYDEDGFCSTISEVGGAVNGVVNGAGGPALSLISLICLISGGD